MSGMRIKRAPKPDRLRALELLASRDGCTDALMIAHGFTVKQMVELVRAGLATARAGTELPVSQPILGASNE